LWRVCKQRAGISLLTIPQEPPTVDDIKILRRMGVKIRPAKVFNEEKRWLQLTADLLYCSSDKIQLVKLIILGTFSMML